MNLRLDRLTTLYLAPAVRRLVAEDKRAIPILMYHGVGGREDCSGRHAYFHTTVSVETFATHMEYLYRDGHRIRTLGEAVALLRSDGSPVGKSVVITFDDGYRDFYRDAFPVLNKFGFTATVFLPTGYIAQNGTGFKGRKCMSWPEVRELQEYGISFGSHTVTHPQLRDLDRDAIERELVDSKKAIEDNTGRPADSFAYPYAFPQADSNFRKVLRDMLDSAGYRNGVCTMVGRATRSSDPFFLERIPVNDADDAAFFAAKLKGAYDWIGWSQSAVKKMRFIRDGTSASAQIGKKLHAAGRAEGSQ